MSTRPARSATWWAIFRPSACSRSTATLSLPWRAFAAPVSGMGKVKRKKVAAGRLQLDDPRPQVGEDDRAEGGRVEQPQLEHSHAIQGMGRHGAAPVRAGLAGASGAQAVQNLSGMLALLRRGSRDQGGRLEQLDHGSQLPGLADPRVRQLDDVAVVEHLRMVHGLFRGPEEHGADVGVLLEVLPPLGQGLLAYGLKHQVPEAHRVLVGREPGSVFEGGVRIDPPSQVQGLDARLPKMGRALRELEPPAVAGHGHEQPVHVVHDRRALDGHRRSLLVPLWILLHQVVDDSAWARALGGGAEPLSERGLDHLAPPGLLPDVEGRQDALKHRLRRAETSVGNRGEGRAGARGHAAGMPERP